MYMISALRVNCAMQLRSDKAFLATRTRDSSMINATTRERRLHTRFDSGVLKRVSTLRKDDKHSLNPFNIMSMI